MTRGDSGGVGGGGGGSSSGGGGGGSSRAASDHSVFLGQSSEMTHSVKLIDKTWHWEEKATDVSLLCCLIGGYKYVPNLPLGCF